VSVVLEKPGKSGRKAKGDGYLRRAEILQAAEELFVREGYHGATIRKIAQDVGLSSTALYMHFRDKSEILVEICGHTFARMRTSNEAIAAQPLTPTERVRRMLEAYIRFGLDNPNAYLVVFERSADISPDKQAALNTFANEMAEPFNAALRALSDAKKLCCTVDEAGQICWAACHGLISLTINHPKMAWAAPPERMTTLVVDTLIQGLLAE
jgi:AcrR family transcriptional regulator